MWSALSSISQYSDKRYLLHDVTSIQFQIPIFASMLHLMKIQNTIAILQMLDRTPYNSTLRHIWSHGSQFVRFCSLRIDVWSSPSDSTSSKKFARKLQTIHDWRNSRIRIAEKITSLREFARKFHAELVRIQSRRHKRLLWKNVENTVFADVLQSGFSWYNLTKAELVRFCWN